MARFEVPLVLMVEAADEEEALRRAELFCSDAAEEANARTGTVIAVGSGPVELIDVVDSTTIASDDVGRRPIGRMVYASEAARQHVSSAADELTTDGDGSERAGPARD